MLHLNRQVIPILRRKELVSLTVIKKNGEKVVFDNVRCTNYNHKNRTVNLLFENSGEFRRIGVLQIIKLNDEEVFL